MSEPTCPNCGSARTYSENPKHGDPCVSAYECGRWFFGDDDRSSKANIRSCQLIRSLREELAGVRDAERDRIAQYVLHLCYIDLAKAIRNNEHRSDT